jgi:hypothetical protein
MSEPQERITLTDEDDVAFLAIVQRAYFNNTTMPSGLVTPPYDYVSEGNDLVLLSGGHNECEMS